MTDEQFGQLLTHCIAKVRGNSSAYTVFEECKLIALHAEQREAFRLAEDERIEWVKRGEYAEERAQKLDLALSSIVEELEDRYDGAPDAHMGWMAELIRIAKEAKGEL
jgi:hypothetical protein